MWWSIYSTYVIENISTLDGCTLIGHPAQRVVVEDTGKEMFCAYEW